MLALLTNLWTKKDKQELSETDPYEQLYATKLDNIDEMNTFFLKNHLP